MDHVPRGAALLSFVALVACDNVDTTPQNDLRNGPQSQSISGSTTPAALRPELTQGSLTVDQAAARNLPPLDPGVVAFRDICLTTAPSFTAAKSAAAVYGVNDFVDLATLAIGSSGNGALSVQIKPGIECAVTTPSRGAANPVLGFVSVVPGITVPTFPATATVGGTSFIFQHDRSGGEAYVMLKR